jgi:hypothetical protein
MGKTFFSFAVADSMFSEVILKRSVLSERDLACLIGDGSGVVSCLNPSHKATIDAAKTRYGLEVPIPERAPQVVLNPGDCLVVMSVRGLPRLDATRHEYTKTEIDSATFVFSLYEVYSAEDNRVCHVIDMARQGMML